jgi:hypothetical protein
MASDWVTGHQAQAAQRPIPPFAARELLESARLDFVNELPSEEAQWDYLVGMSLCDEYDIGVGEDLLKRWFETNPSVKGKRAASYVDAIKAGRELKERVTVQRPGRMERGERD